MGCSPHRCIERDCCDRSYAGGETSYHRVAEDTAHIDISYNACRILHVALQEKEEKHLNPALMRKIQIISEDK